MTLVWPITQSPMPFNVTEPSAPRTEVFDPILTTVLPVRLAAKSAELTREFNQGGSTGVPVKMMVFSLLPATEEMKSGNVETRLTVPPG